MTAPAAETGTLLARPDVSVLRTAEGAWIGVGSASFTVKGGAAFDLVSMLLSRSDGDSTRDDLVQRFPETARAAVRRVLGALVAHGCLVLLDAPLSRHVAESGPAARWLIPQFAQSTADPLSALARLRATTLVLDGRPSWLEGLRTLFDDVLLHGRRIEYHAEPDGQPCPAQGGDHLVLLDADARPHRETVRLQDTLLRHGVPHGIAGTVSGRHWLLWSDEGTTGCWDCLCRYGRARQDDAVPAPAPVPAEQTAATLVHALHMRGAGLGTDTAVSLDPDALTVRPHPVWPVAGCRCHRARPAPVGRPGHRHGTGLIRRNLASPQDDPSLQDDNDHIVSVLADFTDDAVGPFLALDGGDAPQVPFGRASATVLLDTDGEARVHEVPAATLSSREALYQAALNAIEVFAAQPGDPGADAPAGTGARSLGAGWTVDEALYRALLRHTLRRPHDDVASAELCVDDLGDDECARCARYLARTVARATGERGVRWTAGRLPNGLHRAVGHRGGAAVTRGLGACPGEAVSAALLRMVNDESVLVPVNPHFRTWPEVWEHVARPESHEPLRRAVPFVRGRVALVEVA